MTNRDIPYFYLFVYSKLKNKIKNDNYLHTKDVFNTVRNDCKPSLMPNNLIYHMLSQMEEYGLVKRIHRFKYEIVQKNLNLKVLNNKSVADQHKDDFQKIMTSINERGKIHVEDDCLYNLLPSKEVKKLNELNCWFAKA